MEGWCIALLSLKVNDVLAWQDLVHLCLSVCLLQSVRYTGACGTCTTLQLVPCPRLSTVRPHCMLQHRVLAVVRRDSWVRTESVGQLSLCEWSHCMEVWTNCGRLGTGWRRSNTWISHWWCCSRDRHTVVAYGGEQWSKYGEGPAWHPRRLGGPSDKSGLRGYKGACKMPHEIIHQSTIAIYHSNHQCWCFFAPWNMIYGELEGPQKILSPYFTAAS